MFFPFLSDIFIKNEWYDMYKFDLLAFKINGPRYALMGIEGKYKEELFMLIKRDYEEIKRGRYYEDFLTQLGPIKKKFFLDVLSSKDYEEFSKTSR